MKGKKANPSVQRLRAALKALGAPPIVVPHVLADFAGGLEAGSVVAGLLFWCDKGAREDGFFWKSYGEWWDERRVREHTVRRVTRELAKRGLIEIKLMRANGAPTLHYRVTDALVEEIGAFIESQDSQNGFFEIKESDSVNPQNPFFESGESITAGTTAGNAAGNGNDVAPTRPKDSEKQTAADAVTAISASLKENAFTSKQRGALSTALVALGFGYEQTLALWKGCNAPGVKNPVGAFVSAVTENKGQPPAFKTNGKGPLSPEDRFRQLRAKEDARREKAASLAAWHAERAAAERIAP